MLDWMLFRWINGPAGQMPFWDVTMWLAAEAPLGAVWGLLGAIWFWPGATRPLRRRTAVCVALAIILALGLSQLPAWLYYRPRPFMVARVNLLIRPLPTPSFPSDHAATIAAAAVVLGGYSRILGTAGWAVAVVSAYARVYVGVHFVTDGLGGLATGWLAGRLVRQNRDLFSRLAGRVVRRVEGWMPL